jgi:chromate transporter
MIQLFPLLLYLLKASFFSTGGLSNITSLQQDLIGRHWATIDDFNHSIAISQVIPGPNGLWVLSLGYLIYGYIGAGLALVSVILPPLLVLVIDGIYREVKPHPWVKGALRGISLAIVAILLNICWSILQRPPFDQRAWLIAGGAFLLMMTRKLNILVILGLAALVGLLVYH